MQSTLRSQLDFNKWLVTSVKFASGIDVKKNVIVTISADKGLCGGINSTSVKISRAMHKLNSGIMLDCLILSISILEELVHYCFICNC